jgi:hypothetical protein
MQSVSQFNLIQSGYGFNIQNSVAIASGGTLTITYVVNGAPTALTIVVEGVKNTGQRLILNTYTGLTNSTQSISISDSFDAFIVTPVWTDLSNKTSVAVTMTFAGPGQTQTAVQPMLPLSGVGSPQNVVAAPLGSIFMSTSGGSSQTIWIKESGGNGNTGWVAK